MTGLVPGIHVLLPRRSPREHKDVDGRDKPDHDGLDKSMNATDSMPPAAIPVAAVIDFIRRAYAAIGVPEADAAKVAALQVEADLAGADAHGLFRLPQYIRRTQAGGVNPRATIKVEKTAAATALVDGDNGL